MKIPEKSKLRMDNSLIAQKFRSGEIGIFPTDTAFGVGCRMDNVKAVERVYKIRNRPKEKAVLVLVSSIEMAEKYLEEIPQEVIQQLFNKYWPGGLTIILNCKEDKVPEIVRSGGSTLAVRMPDHKELLSIIEEVGAPIIAPSANISGGITPFTLGDVDEDLQSKVDFILPGSCTIKGVSTLIDCTKTPWETVRKGVVDLEISK